MEDLRVLARRRRHVKVVDQVEADARNVAVRTVYGRATTEFFTVENAQRETPSIFWQRILDAIEAVQTTKGEEAHPMTLYERTNILAIRSHQLALNAIPQTDSHDLPNAECAARELGGRLLRFQLRRTYLDGSSEYVDVRDVLPSPAFNMLDAMIKLQSPERNRAPSKK